MHEGALVVIEGGRRVGKMDRSHDLCRKLESTGRKVLVIDELDSLYGQEAPVLEELLDRVFSLRRWLFRREVRHALEVGRIVLVRRPLSSTRAFLHFACRIGLDAIDERNREACQGIRPDVTFILDMKPEFALLRKPRCRELGIPLEPSNITIHRKIRMGFLALAGRERVECKNRPKYAVINAHREPHKVQRAMLRVLSERVIGDQPNERP